MKIINPKEVWRLRPPVRPLLAVLVSLLAVAALGSSLAIHRSVGRAAAAAEGTAALREIRQRLFAARVGLDQIHAGESPAGLFAALQQRHDVAALEETARRALRTPADPSGGLDGTTEAVDRCLDAAHATALLDIQVSLDRKQGKEAEADSLSLEAAALRDSFDLHVARCVIRIDALADRLAVDLLEGSRAARRAEILLALSFAATLILLWQIRLIQKRRARHLHGARLVEEMLEAYSRRLESMNAELEQVSLLKTQFLANTSHELLTPLNGIMGSLELLRGGGCSGPEEEKEFLTQAYNSAEILLALIHDLLDLCRLEEGNLALRCRAVEFGPLLERTVARNRTAIEARGLALLTIPPAEGWPRIQADSERLGQVVQHLLANAIKFTEGGSIRISGRIERSGGEHLRVEVTDTGVGIDPEKLSQVFELFSQADGSHTRRFGGTGLGLTLSRHLIQGMRGRIGIESEGTGRGTRVWFTVPLARAETDTTSAPSAAA